MLRQTIIIMVMASVLAGCQTTNAPDLGEASPARLPELPETLSKPAAPLPPSTAETLSEAIVEGMETDRAYNRLATRFNALLRTYNCMASALERDDDDGLDECLEGSE